MSERIYNQQHELAKLIEHYSGQDGVHPTAIPSLFFIRESLVTEPLYGVYKPSFCIVIQGEKEVMLAKERITYGPADYLVASVNLPVTGQAIKASTDAPYLALKLEFTPNQILEVLSDTEIGEEPIKASKRGLFVCKIEPSLLEPVVRLARLLDNPKDIPVLAPLFTKEILYRVLQGPYGGTLKQMVIEGSRTNRIRAVIDYIMNNFERSFLIEELSELANMSAASLHRHFKEITAMSPIQFQKQLRLQEARRLLLTESTDAADVAFRVGYESPSQFSREYSRMFGLPPREDIKRMREKFNQKINA
ncbi:AraC family transcriptional regulator N-terminal domain-containing protein [Metabacillus sp. Hm71]|uniref:AraC family transcriptional regulator n=1 Tax=Metabacillus sp. Hm71 TaxID=3450743 RepID=UPI003F43AB91